MKEITISKDLSIPLMDYATQATAALGIKGSGKSQDMGFMAEQLMVAGIPITVLDPAGVWQYLKVPGRGQGFPVVVVGGEHPDFPLAEHTIEDITRAAMKEGISIVVDLFTSRPSKAVIRQVVLKCVETMFYENKKHGVRHVIIEEAAEFLPQRVMADHARVYGALEQLVRVGGNCSLGVTMINPRAENLNKDVLELCDYIFLHRQRGRRSLKNLDDWFEMSGLDADQVDKIIAETMLFTAGQCWFLSRDSANPTKVQMPLKQSFHPDRKNPQAEHKAVARTVDVATFVEKLKSALPKPEEKKAAALTMKQVHAPAQKLIIQEVEKIVEVPVLSEKDRELLTLCAAEIGAAKASITAMESQMREVWSRVESEIQKHRLRQSIKPASKPQPWSGHTGRIRSQPVEKPTHDGEIKMSRGIKSMLTALAQHGPMDAIKLGAYTGMVASAGHFGNVLSDARAAGWITGERSNLAISDEGLGVLGPIEPLPTGEQLVAYWRGKLPTRAGDMLQVLFDHGEELSDDQIGEAIGIESSAGHFGNMMSELTKRELVTGKTHARKLHSVFFE